MDKGASILYRTLGKAAFLTISLHKCPLLTSGIDPAWSKYPPGSILDFFWLFKKIILAIFNFLTNFWPSKSSIFLVYSHSRGVSHHFQPSLSSLPIGISHMSLRPTYNLPWTPLIGSHPGFCYWGRVVTNQYFHLTRPWFVSEKQRLWSRFSILRNDFKNWKENHSWSLRTIS